MPKAEHFKGIWEIAVSFSFYPIQPYPSTHPPRVGLTNYWSVPKPISTYFPISCEAGAGILLNSGLYCTSAPVLDFQTLPNFITFICFHFPKFLGLKKVLLWFVLLLCVFLLLLLLHLNIFLVLAKLNFLLLFICSVVSDSLQSHCLQHTRLPCPSPSPRVWIYIMLLFALQEGKII